MPTAMTLQVRGLGKQKMAELVKRAKHFGLSPEQYLKHLLDEDLAIAREAQTTSFADLMSPVRDQFHRSGISEKQLDDLVDRARSRHHRRSKATRK